MAAPVKWSAAPTNQSTVLTTELNALANGAFTAAGPAYDNTTKLDMWAWVEFVAGGSITPTTGAYVAIYMVNSPGGTNFDDAASSTNVATHQIVAVMALQASAHTVRAINSSPFPLPPGKVKFVLKNGSGVALSATSNTLTLYTADQAIG
jgi:hypothetical protein